MSPDWTKAPADLVDAMVGTSPFLIVEAVASTVLSHDDGCSCDLCSWYHS